MKILKLLEGLYTELKLLNENVGCLVAFNKKEQERKEKTLAERYPAFTALVEREFPPK